MVTYIVLLVNISAVHWIGRHEHNSVSTCATRRLEKRDEKRERDKGEPERGEE